VFFEFIGSGFFAGSIPIKECHIFLLVLECICCRSIAGYDNEFAIHFLAINQCFFMLKAIISSFDFLAIRSVLAVCKIYGFHGSSW
jgi:hypothetical protein